MAEKNCECAAPAIMYHVIYENFRPLTDFSEHLQIVPNGKDFGKVTACYSHVIEPWQQLHVSISANRIVDFVILVHAIIDYSLLRGPYSIQSNTCVFPFSHGLKCAAERSSLYLEVVRLHIPTQGYKYCRDCMFLLLYKIIALFCVHFRNLAGRRFVSLERFLHVLWKSIHLIRARKNPWD